MSKNNCELFLHLPSPPEAKEVSSQQAPPPWDSSNGAPALSSIPQAPSFCFPTDLFAEGASSSPVTVSTSSLLLSAVTSNLLRFVQLSGTYLAVFCAVLLLTRGVAGLWTCRELRRKTLAVQVPADLVRQPLFLSDLGSYTWPMFNHTADALLRDALKARYGTDYGCPPDPQRRDWWPAIAPKREPPEDVKIAFVFPLQAGLSMPAVWQRWLPMTGQWSFMLAPAAGKAPEGLAPGGSPAGGFSSPTALIVTAAGPPGPAAGFEWRTAENAAPASPPGQSEFLPGLPPALRSALGDPAVTHILVLPETAFPVKPFEYVRASLKRNPRSRIAFTDVNFPGVRRHSPWLVLARAHAELLAQQPELWTCAAALQQPDAWEERSCRRELHWKRARTEEYLPFLALSQLLGEHEILREFNSGIFSPLPLHPMFPEELRRERPVAMEFEHVYGHRADACAELGTLDARGLFEEIREQPLLQLLRRKDVWFVERGAEDTMVEQRQQLSQWLLANVMIAPPLVAAAAAAT